MKASKFVVLVGGVLGLIAFFLPLIAVQKSGVSGKLSAYRIVAGITAAQQVVDKASALPEAQPNKKDFKEANDTLGAIKGIVIGLFVPVWLLLLIGGIGAARKKFGRVAGSFSLLVGLIGLGVASLLLGAAQDKTVTSVTNESVAGVGMYVMFLAAALGAIGGIMTLIKPDKG